MLCDTEFDTGQLEYSIKDLFMFFEFEENLKISSLLLLCTLYFHSA